jgi:hypothetical protein
MGVAAGRGRGHRSCWLGEAFPRECPASAVLEKRGTKKTQAAATVDFPPPNTIKKVVLGGRSWVCQVGGAGARGPPGWPGHFGDNLPQGDPQ